MKLKILQRSGKELVPGGVELPDGVRSCDQLIRSLKIGKLCSQGLFTVHTVLWLSFNMA